MEISLRLKLAKGRIAQYADYLWRSGPDLWVGDAKYKHLAAGQTTALRFTDLPDTNGDQADGVGATPQQMHRSALCA